jgi:hypothetical protein
MHMVSHQSVGIQQKPAFTLEALYALKESVPVIIIVKQLRLIDSTKHHMVDVGFALLTGTSWHGNHLVSWDRIT